MSFNHPLSKRKTKSDFSEFLSKVMIKLINFLFKIIVFASIYRIRVFIKFSKLKIILN